MDSQSSAFGECFCFDIQTQSMCNKDWSFFNNASCRQWLGETAAYLLFIFILSWIFFVCIFICCCGARGCGCCVSTRVTTASVVRTRIGFIIAAGACGVLIGGMIITSIKWAEASHDVVVAARSTVDGLFDMNLEAVTAIQNLDTAVLNSTYVIEARKARNVVPYSVTDFVTTQIVTKAAQIRHEIADAKEVANTVFSVFSDIYENESFGRPAATLWLCGWCSVSLLVLCFFVLFPNRGCCVTSVSHRYKVGVAAGFFVFGCYLLLGFIISFSTTSAAITNDLCSVYQKIFSPTVVYLARKGDACDRVKLADAAHDGADRFSEFLLDTAEGFVNPNACFDAVAVCIWLELVAKNATYAQGIDCLNITGCNTQNPFPLVTIGGTNVTLRNVSLWGNLFTQGKGLLQCVAECPEDTRNAAVRLIALRENIFTNVNHLVFSTLPQDFNCHLLRTDLDNTYDAMCNKFAPASTNFAIVGGIFLGAALVLLVAVRYSITHDVIPTAGNMTQRSFTARRQNNNNGSTMDAQQQQPLLNYGGAVASASLASVEHFGSGNSDEGDHEDRAFNNARMGALVVAADTDQQPLPQQPPVGYGSISVAADDNRNHAPAVAAVATAAAGGEKEQEVGNAGGGHLQGAEEET